MKPSLAVMAGLVPAIHVFAWRNIARHGCRAFAGHECDREAAMSARCESVREGVVTS
jgi:hypothetical protein